MRAAGAVNSARRFRGTADRRVIRSRVLRDHRGEVPRLNTAPIPAAITPPSNKFYPTSAVVSLSLSLSLFLCLSVHPFSPYRRENHRDYSPDPRIDVNVNGNPASAFNGLPGEYRGDLCPARERILFAKPR